ncbi:hypothetical protein C8F04DRAFT_1268583 [Mycena alexandri]|uniref:Uncharacterized protein n=1 Tax=Mycena alexandri TaxID=1745969 RepID=A0AAD6SH28_9AGAR|nr:hypothetical protein C8F04DRAFT_1268583 [Mycena alexandri]
MSITTDLTMSVVLSPLSIIRSASSPTPRPSSTDSLMVPSSFFGPCGRAFDQSEDCGPLHGCAFEQADSPCFAARDFEAIIAYLPRIPDIASSFKRVGGCFRQHRPLFFVVEDHEEIFTSALEAQRFHIETGDPTLGIYVFTSREQAKSMFI